MTNSTDKEGLLSIGELSTASGVAVETLRNWERRYGFPEPERRDSGHRRYPWELVDRLRLIRQVIEMGYKPSFTVAAPEADLAEIATRTEQETRKRVEESVALSTQDDLARWLDNVDRLDAEGLEQNLRRGWSRYGAFQFVTRLAMPFFREVGDRWADGRYTVAQEHFASEIAQNVLANQWRPLSNQSSGQRVVMANLEGELHSLGLHMAAVFVALNRLEVVFLGPNTPNADIVATAKEPRVVAVIIGLSAASDVDKSTRRLKQLRDKLPAKAVVAVGGNDRIPDLAGIERIDTFELFADWALGSDHTALIVNPGLSPKPDLS